MKRSDNKPAVTLPPELQHINQRIKELIAIQDERNQYLLAPPANVYEKQIDEAATELKYKIDDLEEEIQKLDAAFAETHPQYKAPQTTSPSFLEPRKFVLPKSDNKLGNFL